MSSLPPPTPAQSTPSSRHRSRLCNFDDLRSNTKTLIAHFRQAQGYQSLDSSTPYYHKLTKPFRLAVAFILLALISPAHAQLHGKADVGFEHQARAFEAMEAGNYADAETQFRAQLETQPDNFVPWYNLACALSMQSKTDEAVKSLARAIKLGFCDRAKLETDEQLAHVRETVAYKKILDNWHAILQAQGEATFERLKKQFGRRYHTESDESARLHYITEKHDESFEQARREIELLTDWGLEHVFHNLRPDPKATDTLANPWVTIVLPSRRDFHRWSAQEFGQAGLLVGRNIGGSYSHDRKQLVAMDQGSTLRHEFFHVLHWRSNTKSGNVHPIWIQEGLCALVEDFDITPGGELKIALSWRSNIAKGLALKNRLLDIDALATLPPERFSNANPLANYAQARTFFLYLTDSDKLGQWYRTYDETFDEDPTGIAAIERVFEKPIEEVNAAYQRWVRGLPEVADLHNPPRARLGIEIDAGEGSGVEVLKAHRTSPLRPGDVIVSINSRPTKDINELYRVLGDYEPGRAVTVRYRRLNRYDDAAVTLIE